MKKKHKYLWIVIVVVALFGCVNPIPMQKSENASVVASENLGSQNAVLVERTVHGEKTPQMPNLSVSGASNAVEVVVNPAKLSDYTETTVVDSKADQKATSELDQSWISSSTLPLGIALLFTAAGIAALIMSVKYARKSSVAVDQLFGAADEGLGEIGRQVRSKMIDALRNGDHKESAALATILADLEANRGRLQAKSKQK